MSGAHAARLTWQRRASAEMVRVTSARSPQGVRAARAARGCTAAIWRLRSAVARALFRATAPLRACPVRSRRLATRSDHQGRPPRDLDRRRRAGPGVAGAHGRARAAHPLPRHLRPVHRQQQLSLAAQEAG
jgi:hypothetical protein